VQRERQRLEHSTSYRLGHALVAFGARPWEVPDLCRALAGLVRHRHDRPASTEADSIWIDPGLPPGPLPLETDTERRRLERMRLDTVRMRSSLAALQGSTAARTGAWVVRLALRPWAALRLPWVLGRLLARGLREPPLPITGLEARAVRALPVHDAPPARPSWACIAPSWLEEMLAHESVVPLDRVDGMEAPLGCLVCLDGRRDDHGGPHELLRRVRSLRRRGAKVALWQIGPELAADYDPVLSEADRVYADDTGAIPRLARRGAACVGHLAPAVQPRLQNPIGWWSGHAQPQRAWEARRPHPAAWQTLFDAARGLHLSRRDVEAIERALGAPIRQAPVPPWADADEALDRQRFERVRRILRDETLARRVMRLSADLGLPREPARERASVILCSKRPHRVGDAIRTFAEQTYADKELVLVLHGDGFDRAAIQARLDALQTPARVLRVPARRTLGECMQLGCDESDGRWVFKMDDDDWYGPGYLESQVLALSVSQAGAATKHTQVVHLEQTGTFLLWRPGWEFRYTQVSWGGGMVIRREVFDMIQWRPIPRGIDTAFFDDCASHSVPLLATDRFNAIRMRGRPQDHTWQVPGRYFVSSGRARTLPGIATVEDFRV
jgi:hypothetical protein